MKLLTVFITSLLLMGAAHKIYAQDDHAQHEEQSSQHDVDHDDEEHEDHEDHDDEEDGDHEGDHDEHGDESNSAQLNAQQVALANIRVAELQPQVMDYQIYTPGEIKANGYTSYIVSPRVDSVVLQRHVALGIHVEKGQALVTLFSETVADAQANFQITGAEWQRVKQLGRTAVGDKRFVEGEAGFNASRARLFAFGLSDTAINNIGKNGQTLGEYTLNALNAGAVLSDDFHQGQRIESGEALMEIADETELWVEARLAPTTRLALPSGSEARIKVGDNFFTATVTQEAHTIDPVTRTRVVRLSVLNQGHQLHPGLFADVFFSFATDEPVLAVPESALMRGADGDWTVFIEEEPGEFKPHEVELGRSLGEWREISGIDPGSRVVMEGAFFVASEIAKGGFDPHNH